MIQKTLRAALTFLLAFTVLTGVAYPLIVTGLAQLLFPSEANGSQIIAGNKIMGSQLIGQEFSDPGYFWGRLSNTSGYPYNASASGGSNYSVLNPLLQKQVENRIIALQSYDPSNTQPIPVDLVTSSGSGLDPDISIQSALYQAPRVAQNRGVNLDEIQQLIREYTHYRFLGFFGEPYVNVLELNLALDGLQ